MVMLPRNPAEEAPDWAGVRLPFNTTLLADLVNSGFYAILSSAESPEAEGQSTAVEVKDNYKAVLLTLWVGGGSWWS